jgi:hypothetical protein
MTNLKLLATIAAIFIIGTMTSVTMVYADDDHKTRPDKEKGYYSLDFAFPYTDGANLAAPGSGGPGTVDVFCNAGDQIISGGGFVFGGTHQTLRESRSFTATDPTIADGPNHVNQMGWRVTAEDSTGTTDILPAHVYIVCLHDRD